MAKDPVMPWTRALELWLREWFQGPNAIASRQVLEYSVALVAPLLLGGLSVAHVLEGRLWYLAPTLYCGALVATFALGALVWLRSAREMLATMGSVAIASNVLWSTASASLPPEGFLRRAWLGLISISCVSQFSAAMHRDESTVLLLFFSAVVAAVALLAGGAWCLVLMIQSFERAKERLYALSLAAEPDRDGVLRVRLFGCGRGALDPKQAWVESAQSAALLTLLDVSSVRPASARDTLFELRVPSPERVAWHGQYEPFVDLVLVFGPSQSTRFRLPFGLDAFRPRSLSNW